MSMTFELIEPAGAMLSMLRQGMVRDLLVDLCVRGCDIVLAGSAVMLVLLEDIPSGVKIRSRTKSSQLLPVQRGDDLPGRKVHDVLVAELATEGSRTA